MSIVDADSIEDLPEDFFDDFTKGDFLESLRRAAESGDLQPHPPAYERSSGSKSPPLDVHDRLIQEIRRLEKDIAERRRKLCRSPMKSSFFNLKNETNNYNKSLRDCTESIISSSMDYELFNENNLSLPDKTRDTYEDLSVTISRDNPFFYSTSLPDRDKQVYKRSEIKTNRSCSKSTNSADTIIKYRRSTSSSSTHSLRTRSSSGSKNRNSRSKTPIQYKLKNTNYSHNQYNKYKWERKGFERTPYIKQENSTEYCRYHTQKGKCSSQSQINKTNSNCTCAYNTNGSYKNQSYCSKSSTRSRSWSRNYYSSRRRHKSRSPIRFRSPKKNEKNYRHGRSRSRSRNRSKSSSRYRTPKRNQQSFLEELAQTLKKEGKEFPEGDNKPHSSLMHTPPPGYTSIQSIGGMFAQFQTVQNNIVILNQYNANSSPAGISPPSHQKVVNNRPKHSPILAPMQDCIQQNINVIYVCTLHFFN